MTIVEEKKSLRKTIKTNINTLYANLELRENISDNICKTLLCCEEYKSADFVFSYIPKFPELDCTKINVIALTEKKLFVPKVEYGTYNMDFYELNPNLSLREQLEEGSFGILEPLNSLKKVNLNIESFFDKKKVLMIVPGVAFTKIGHRLGKGKGFYDRYIPKLKKICDNLIIVGICYPEQILKTVPINSLDFKMDKVFY